MLFCFIARMDKIDINNCVCEDLLTIPGEGEKIANKIWHMREDWGTPELEHLTRLLHFRVTPQFLEMITFSPERGSAMTPRRRRSEMKGNRLRPTWRG